MLYNKKPHAIASLTQWSFIDLIFWQKCLNDLIKFPVITAGDATGANYVIIRIIMPHLI